MKKLIECVPNFSEGRDLAVIREITAAITSVEGAVLLDTDPGASTNRTVVTFVGEPDAVVEAAFRAIARAAELIDMSRHKGAHPRMGATDVCPLVPLDGVSDEEAVGHAHRLARRVGEELKIPVYLYEKAATTPGRRNLAEIRQGEYEGFAEKIRLPAWKPDYGPQAFHARAGQTAIGVRKLLVAYNVNLNTRSVRRANSVAFDVREKGRVKTCDGTLGGEKVLDAAGEPVFEKGACEAVKGIGWFVEEYGVAQVSLNLTDLDVTPLHAAFDACVESAHRRGLRVTGSEVVGLVPRRALLDAGRYFLAKQNRSRGVPEEELVQIAVKSLGLDDLRPFDPREKVIEYRIEDRSRRRLADLSLRAFCDRTASESPAPGGGSAAALAGALGAALAAMVANLSANKRGWDDRVEELSRVAVEAQERKDELLALVDADTEAYNQVLAASRLPAGNDTETALRVQALDEANRRATLVPVQVMETALRAHPLVAEMVERGNPNSMTDAAVGALLLDAAVAGAGLNARVNLAGIEDQAFRREIEAKVAELREKARELSARILAAVEAKL